MPIYEYQCGKCGEIFDKLESISSGGQTAICPKCGDEAQKKVSLTSYHLTGQGFHNTDYKESCCPKATGGETPSCCTGCPSQK